MWENIFSINRTLIKRFFVALAMALIGFSLIYILYNFIGRYFTSLIEITIILIVFYSGFFIGLSFAVLSSIAVDYLFISPTGSIFKSFAGNERFIIIIIIIITLTILATTLASTLKSAFQKVALAKKETEFATSMMEEVIALVVHDIRNPLTTIKMGAQIILKTSVQLEKHQTILKNEEMSLIISENLLSYIPSDPVCGN